MTTVPHNPVTDGPLVIALQDDAGDPQDFDTVQIRIQAGAACMPVNGSEVQTDDGPQWEFTIPDLPVRVYPTTIHADAGDGFEPVGQFVLKITGAC
jgi:hypothetical protein